MAVVAVVANVDVLTEEDVGVAVELQPSTLEESSSLRFRPTYYNFVVC